MIKLFKSNVLYSDGDSEPGTTCGYVDAGRAASISRLDTEIGQLKPRVTKLKNILEQLGEYNSEYSQLSDKYNSMNKRFDKVGQFGEDNIDAEGLFSGSQECLKNISSSIVSIKEQGELDLEKLEGDLRDLEAERKRYDDDIHLGEVYVCN